MRCIGVALCRAPSRARCGDAKTDARLGLLHLIRADTVLAYQRIRLFVWANSMKTVVFDTYREIPNTGFKHP
ncbi:predicted protein [Ostreococcus lucimarinus CCE9901]|uniref:Uncharacterized protein n=1 Tax=Ostreococcus lucimarinus (strain CCE9901) TaxID=436017 RepID=A4S261_OSTLU|nr:predicted protein [Ostreococcus lucimarinus CCE9901]ABO97986.1 predicted protein [Ostreococcus lucimarinus CCE9901]|eukprot:XP_001419693.1 predicted protein [Ostreococcus lucimarinus CCE9901]